MTPTPTLLSWSGGKDCLMALQQLRGDPHWQVVGLLTTVDRTYQRVVVHNIHHEVLSAQAHALGLPLLKVAVDWPTSEDVYEAALADVLGMASRRWPGLRHCTFGDLFLHDIRDFRVRQLGRLGWRPLFPLWGENTSALARRFIADGHRASLCCVDTHQLDAGFCGRDFDGVLLDTLPTGIDRCGERGEFHTVAWSSPLFRQPLNVRRGESVLRDSRFQFTDFLLDHAPKH